MRKIVKNLTLDPESVKRGEQYSRRKGASMSQLVSDFLSRLPTDDQPNFPPAVARLFGIAAGKNDKASYHRYLEKKYSR